MRLLARDPLSEIKFPFTWKGIIIRRKPVPCVQRRSSSLADIGRDRVRVFVDMAFLPVRRRADSVLIKRRLVPRARAP